MTEKYREEADVLRLVRSFEAATISRDEWKHAEHLIVAMYYLSHHDLDTAAGMMKSGILNLLKNGFGVDLAKEMPYHETLTIFWMRTVADFLRSTKGASLPEKIGELTATYDKDYPLRFYSREFLFSDEARNAFVEGDLVKYSRN